MKLIRIAALALICCPAASRSLAEERYFVVVYSAQLRTINLPRYAHTWGTFVKLSRADEHGEYSVEIFTISWLPTTLDVRPARLRPEVGVNLTLRETLDYCAGKNMEVRQLGPYPIDPELYRIERERYDSLQRGERLYVAGDLMNTPRRETDCNCIYALAAPVARQQVFRLGTFGFGYLAGTFVKRRFDRYILDDSESCGWVSDLIGVEEFPPIRFGFFRGPVE